MDSIPSDEGFPVEAIETVPDADDSRSLERALEIGDVPSVVLLSCRRARQEWARHRSDEALSLWFEAVRLASPPRWGAVLERPVDDLRRHLDGWADKPEPSVVAEAWLLEASELLRRGDPSGFLDVVEEATGHLLDRYGDTEPRVGTLLEQAAHFAGNAGLYGLMGELADRAVVHSKLEQQIVGEVIDVEGTLERVRLCWVGLLHSEEHERALPHLELYCELCRRESRIKELAGALEQLAECHMKRGDLDAAWSAYVEAEDAHNAVRTGPEKIAQLVGLRAAIDHRRGRMEEARFGFMRALAGFDLAGVRGLDTVGVLMGYSTFLRAVGEHDEAQALASLASSRTRAALTPPGGMRVTPELAKARARARSAPSVKGPTS